MSRFTKGFMMLLMTTEAPGSKSRAHDFDGLRSRLNDLARRLLWRRRNVVEPRRSDIVINLNPQTLSLIASAATTAIKAVPKGQLARLGLTRAPLAAPLALSPLPMAAAAAGGALVVALVVPSSRRWLLAKATTLTTAVRSKMLSQDNSDQKPHAEEAVTESTPASDVANGHASVA